MFLHSNFGFHSFDMGQMGQARHSELPQREAQEAPALLKIVPVYIKEFLFLFLLIPPALKTQAHPQWV